MKDMEATVAQAVPAASPDAERVKAARRGDQQAFADLYQAHAGRLMTVLWRLAGGDRALAEDWLQDAFVQAWRSEEHTSDSSHSGESRMPSSA